MYFQYNGLSGFVIQEYDDLIYALIRKGDFLGLIDLLPDKHEIKDGLIQEARRKFTVQCMTEWCEFLCLSVTDFERVKEDFPIIFDEMFVNAMSRLRKLRMVKKEAARSHKQKEKATEFLTMFKTTIKRSDRMMNAKKMTEFDLALKNRNVCEELIHINEIDDLDMSSDEEDEDFDFEELAGENKEEIKYADEVSPIPEAPFMRE